MEIPTCPGFVLLASLIHRQVVGFSQLSHIEYAMAFDSKDRDLDSWLVNMVSQDVLLFNLHSVASW